MYIAFLNSHQSYSTTPNTQGIVAWALDGTSFDDGYYGGCNTDIQLHINKGAIGLRIDNIIGFEVNNVDISGLINTGNLGTETTVCGAYTQGNAHQDPLITAGYTGTEGYGITITQSVDGKLNNVSIHDLETYYGFATGVALFKDSSVDFGENIVIDDIVAGSHLMVGDLRPDQEYLPNKIPMACSVFDNNYNTKFVVSGEVTASNVQGYLLCDEEAMIGDCDSSCTALYDDQYFDDLIQMKAVKEGRLFSMDRNTSKSMMTAPVIAVMVLFMILAVFILIKVIIGMCRWICCRRKQNSLQYVGIQEKMSSRLFSSESTPLLLQ